MPIKPQRTLSPSHRAALLAARALRSRNRAQAWKLLLLAEAVAGGLEGEALKQLSWELDCLLFPRRVRNRVK